MDGLIIAHRTCSIRSSLLEKLLVMFGGYTLTQDNGLLSFKSLTASFQTHAFLNLITQPQLYIKHLILTEQTPSADPKPFGNER